MQKKDVEQLLKRLPKNVREKCLRGNSFAAPHVERAFEHATARQNAGKGNGAPCCIAIHSFRHRLADADGVSGKAAIDGLVQAGILADDSPEFVRSVSFTQEKSEVEKTVITLTWEE